MARQKFDDFEQWVIENEFSEDDLSYIAQNLRRRALFWFLLSWTYVAIPLFMVTWARYKHIKQRTFSPRPGLLFTLCSLTLYFSFLMIIPLIIWVIARNTDWGTGMNGLFKKGLVGDGEESDARRQIWEKIRKGSRIVRVLICAVLTVILYVLAIAGGEPLGIEYTAVCFFTLDLFGIIICAIVNNIRYRRHAAI